MKFHCMVALVTPMQVDGQVDYAALSTLIAWHIAAGTEAIVILGTTGESPTLSAKERTEIIKVTLSQAKGRLAVFVGTGTNNTSTAIALAQEAQNLNADGLLIINPYYNKPTQSGLYLHFKVINDAVNIPIILYNHPGRTGGNLENDTIHRLSQLQNIIGIKEASGDIERVSTLRQLCHPEFSIWSGCDDNTVDFIQAGGNGIISVTANIAPTWVQQVVRHALIHDIAAAHHWQQKLMPLHQATNLETNPIPVKYALYLMKKISTGIRLPLTLLEKNQQKILEKVLQDLQLIPSMTKDTL